MDLINAMDTKADIVVEAWFKLGGFQRESIEHLAQANGYTVQWWEFVLDREIAKRRVEADYAAQVEAHPEKEDLLRIRRDARLRLLDIAAW